VQVLHNFIVLLYLTAMFTVAYCHSFPIVQRCTTCNYMAACGLRLWNL